MGTIVPRTRGTRPARCVPVSTAGSHQRGESGHRNPETRDPRLYALEWVTQRLSEIYGEARRHARPSPLNEAAAHLYKVLAMHVSEQQFETKPIRLLDLVPLMHCEVGTIRRARNRLRDLGEIRQKSGGPGAKESCYTFVRMGGPLLIPALANTAERLVNLEPTARTPAADLEPTERGSVQPRAQESKFMGEHSLVRDLVEGVTSTSQPDAAAPTTLLIAHTYAQWYASHHPEYRGVPGVLNGDELEVVVELLRERSLGLLQAMTITMWTMTADEDERSDRSWVAGTNRSIFVLRWKAIFLEIEARRNDLRPECAPNHAELWGQIGEKLRPQIGGWHWMMLRGCRVTAVRPDLVRFWVPSEEQRDLLVRHGVEDRLCTVIREILPGRHIELSWGDCTPEAAG